MSKSPVTVKRVFVVIRHVFDLDIPDTLLDEEDDQWALDQFVYDAFEEEDWEFNELSIRDIKESE